MSPNARQPGEGPEPEARAELLLQQLHTSAGGLSSAEAARRKLQYGPNELRRRGGAQWPRELAGQLVHPLALLLWVAAALSFAVGNAAIGVAVVLVILLNATFAFAQELQAERAVEALARYMPQRATVIRDGVTGQVDAVDLVPGDVVVLEEGERVPADVRLLAGALEIDLSTLTGESDPVERSAALQDHGVPRLEARDLAFSGTTCTGGEARAVVFATGMHTELGRIAALSERVDEAPSPLERQVRRVAWLIAAVAVAMALAFVPIAMLAAGLSLRDSVVFAVGLLAGNVPEGLLPVITLALAVAVSALARRGALVKRLSAVETLGGTDVICTDKTGTLTENRMAPVAAWTVAGEIRMDGAAGGRDPSRVALAEVALACTTAEPGGAGDPTELALLEAAGALRGGVATADLEARDRDRRHLYRFDPELKLMTTLDRAGTVERLSTKGAPESVLPRCITVLGDDGVERGLSAEERARIVRRVEAYAHDGLRVLALARRFVPTGRQAPPRSSAERDLCFLGLVTMLDPPRPEVPAAVAECHRAGIRIIVVTGDHPLTAAAIARRVGIGGEDLAVVRAERYDHRATGELEELLAGGREIVFARASPEAKLHIAEALQAAGHVVAMTGDGVNDAPALKRADIGVAMGLAGTDVAREAAAMALTDDNFASIVTAVSAGRQVYDNVRKFIVYIFTHAPPEVVPFLVFALAGGSIPLPLTVPLILAFDVGFETLPSLALGRDPADPANMRRPPRPRAEGVIRRPMLIRAWLFLGPIIAVLCLAAFFSVLAGAGWHPGDHVGPGTRLHHAYLQATTMTFLGLIAGQIGTAFTLSAGRWSLRRGRPAFGNPFLLAAVAAELIAAAGCVYLPPIQSLLGTAALPAGDLLLLVPFPFVVLGADAVRERALRRARRPHRAAHVRDSPQSRFGGRG